MKTLEWAECLIVLIIWGTSSTLVSVFIEGTNPIIMAGIVVTISFAILTMVLGIFNKNYLHIIKQLKFMELKKLLLPSFLGFFLYPMAYFIGISGISPVNANILNYLWPVIAVITLKIVEKNKYSKFELISIILAFIGGYIVLSLNNYHMVEFKNSDSRELVFALIGACSYGIYTALIERYTPKVCLELEKENNDIIPLPGFLRTYGMIAFSFMGYCALFILFAICKPDEIFKTVIMITCSHKKFLSVIFYAIINFTLAHFLWNKINKIENIAITATMAFVIPFLSTIVLSIATDIEIGFMTTIGLIFIVISIIIINKENINTINATFIGMFILLLLLGIVPIIGNIKIKENAEFFLEIIVAIYSIYYGFTMSRIVRDYKEVERIIVDTMIAKRGLDENELGILKEIEKNAFLPKKENQTTDTQNNLINRALHLKFKSNIHETIIRNYIALYRYDKQFLSISEWSVIILLSLAIITLCFIIRRADILSSAMVLVIGTAICLCVSSLYEYYLKKKQSIRGFLKRKED